MSLPEKQPCVCSAGAKKADAPLRKESARCSGESETLRNNSISQVCRPEMTQMTSVYNRIFIEPIMAISPQDLKAPFPPC